MAMSIALRILLSLALGLAPAGADAVVLFFKARLEGGPAGVTTNADGAGLFTYDTASRSIGWTVTYRNLSSAITGAHLHGPAAPGADAPIVVPMTLSASPLTGNATITALQEADLLAGLWYVNVHTANNLAGEIRGQLEPVDTNNYSVSYGTGGPSSSTISGTVTFDPATGLMTWNIGWSVPLLHLVTGTDFHGPARGTENAPVTIPAPTRSGAATLTAAQGAELVNGFWYFQVSDINGAFRAYVLPLYPRLSAISTRLDVLQGDDVAIAGFVIGGTAAKPVVVVAQGPSLAGHGIADPLADPKLTIVRASDQAVIATNDDWQTDPNAFYIFGYASDPKEAALLLTLPPGAYTAVVSGANGGTGVALVAVYERNAPESPLIGISTRGKVLLGDNVMIGGFIIDGAEPMTIVVRARGPSLAAAGVSGVLANPTLQLVRASDQTVIAFNDDWQTAANAAALLASGFAPADSLEAAILITLAPGAYTAIVAGQADGTGVGIVEVFAVP